MGPAVWLQRILSRCTESLDAFHEWTHRHTRRPPNALFQETARPIKSNVCFILELTSLIHVILQSDSPKSFPHTIQPAVMLAPRWPTAMASLRQCVRQSQAPTLRRALCSSTPTTTPRSASFLYSYRLALATTMPGVALGLSLSTSKPLLCASDRSYASATDVEPVPVESSINLQDLSFGTVSGICVGVFLKKGLKVRSLQSETSRVLLF